MKRKIFFILLIVSFSTGVIRSQTSAVEMSRTLEKLFGRLRAVTGDSIRLRINDSIKSVVESYTVSDKVFSQTLSGLHYLGQITSPDALIKIITWNLVLTNEPGKYFCYFIRRSPDGNPNKVYSLTHDYDDKQILTDTIYDESDWYGALYYDIKPFYAENRRSWVLLGINYSNPLITRKVIDVLSFTPEDKILFGRKWFDSGGAIKFRHVLEYSSSAAITLRFSSEGTIIFDHLVPLPPEVNDERIYYGPDYSYDAYTFDNGIWNLSINVDARNRQK